MASVTPRINAHGEVTSYRVQFRIDGKQTGESFPTPDAAEKFGKLVDRVGGRDGYNSHWWAEKAILEHTGEYHDS